VRRPWPIETYRLTYCPSLYWFTHLKFRSHYLPQKFFVQASLTEVSADFIPAANTCTNSIEEASRWWDPLRHRGSM